MAFFAAFLSLWTGIAVAQANGQIRLVNSTGQVLTGVMVVTCDTSQPAARLDPGETVETYDVRFFSVAPGCYVIEVVYEQNGAETAKEQQVNVASGIQYDVSFT